MGGSSNKAAKKAAKEEQAQLNKLELEKQRKNKQLQRQLLQSRKATFSSGSTIDPQNQIG